MIVPTSGGNLCAVCYGERWVTVSGSVTSGSYTKAPCPACCHFPPITMDELKKRLGIMEHASGR